MLCVYFSVLCCQNDHVTSENPSESERFSGDCKDAEKLVFIGGTEEVKLTPPMYRSSLSDGVLPGPTPRIHSLVVPSD